MIDLTDGAATSAGQLSEAPNFVLIDEVRQPPRLTRPRQRLLVPWSNAGLVIHEDAGAEFAANDESRMLLPPYHRRTKDSYLERAHNAYRMTDISDLLEQGGLQHRIDMIV